MRIKRYRAATMAEALAQVRRELGPDAILLEVRTARAGWLARFGLGRRRVEVLAAADVPAPRPAARPAGGGLPAPGGGSPLPPLAGPAASPEPTAAGEDLPPCVPADADPDARRVVAVVGPTGAGKTTSLAKLAARAAVLEGRPTVLITLDTYRVGAVEQLRIYADIMAVPLHVVQTPDDMAAALAASAGAQRVFIDTPGRNHGDRWAIGRLARILEVARPDEVHLVVPVQARVADAQAYAPVYRRLGADRLLITKLDETADRRGLVELPRRLGLPVSYLAFGQEVPDDIAPATPGTLRRFLEVRPEAASPAPGSGGWGT